MDQQTIFLTILGMMAVTYIPRALPLLALARRTLPESVVRWLSFVPVAVLAAMLMPSLIVHSGKLDFSLQNVFFWAAPPTFFVSWKTGNAALAVGTGMACVAAGRFFFQ